MVRSKRIDKHNEINVHRKGVRLNTAAKAAVRDTACDPAENLYHGKAEWKERDSQMGGRTDRKHTHVGLISRTGWSGRSSPSGSTQCPFQRSSVLPDWSRRGVRRDSSCGREGELAAVLRRRSGLL